MEETIMFIYVATGILTGIYFIFNEIKKETDDFTMPRRKALSFRSGISGADCVAVLKPLIFS